jgi:hypothetical protein
MDTDEATAAPGSGVLAALAAERDAYLGRGRDDRAAQAQAQIDALAGAGAERAAQPAKAARAKAGRQTRSA